jgi:hypothetical protein
MALIFSVHGNRRNKAEKLWYMSVKLGLYYCVKSRD